MQVQIKVYSSLVFFLVVGNLILKFVNCFSKYFFFFLRNVGLRFVLVYPSIPHFLVGRTCFRVE